jgi:hypothetical protein
MPKTKVVKVNLKSRSMLPKYSDAELTGLAERVGLTLEQLKEIHRAAHATYQAIGADLAECNEGRGMKRADLVEVVLDASYMESFGWYPATAIPAELKEWLRTKSMQFPLDQVYQAVGAGFLYPGYE